MNDVILSKRMETVVNMLLPQSFGIVADVGCDHAYVSIALMQRKIAEKVIAMDVRKGPLEIAKKNIHSYHLSNVIDLRLGDGLEQLKTGEADAIILAGMGGLLMRGILERGMSVWKEAEEKPVFVLQPQSDIDAVRHFLYDNGYYIVREEMLQEDGKYYTVLRAEEGIDEQELNEEQWLYGPCLLRDCNETLYSYLQNEKQVLFNIYTKLEEEKSKQYQNGKAVSLATETRLIELTRERNNNEKALSYYGGN